MPTDKQSESSECPHDPKDSPQLSLDDQAFLGTRTIELISQGVLPGVASRRARQELYEKIGARGVVGGISPNIPLDDDDGEGPSSPRLPHHPPTPLFTSLPSSSNVIRSRLREIGIHNVNYLFRHFTMEEIEEALKDYDTGLRDGFKPRNPSGYFRSLL